MKKLMKSFALLAVAALGLSACNDEKLVPDNGNADGKFVTVHFGAEAAIEGATKATLTTEDEKTFKSAWENGDVLSVKYSNDNKTAGATTSGVVSATWTTDHFDATLPKYNGTWNYNVVYPVPDAESMVDFGSARTQKGNAYNSKYDLMKGSATAKGADAGMTADRKNVVFNMTRQTAIAYFHLTSTLDEEVVSAKLSVEGGNIASSLVKVSGTDYSKGFDLSVEDLKEITITFTEAPTAKDIRLWFNVLPTSYTSMSLVVETTGHTLTLNNSNPGTFAAQKLYKVKGDVSSKWVEIPSVSFFYESFDSCNGTGGNDGQWSGQIATNTIATDNKGWTFANEKGANACAKFGAGSKMGNATTPALGINTSSATLSFKAGAWNGKDEATKINITANNGGTVSPSSIILVKGQWTEYVCNITGATEQTTITFSASTANNDNRFFLDEVMVYYGKKPVVKHVQQISFDKTSLECFVDEVTITEPKLSGAKTVVTYSSSDEKVATVDAVSGKVTILSAGNADIIATAEENEEYKSATAKYSLKVNKHPQTLSFEKSNYSVLIADKDTFVSPVVSGAKTAVSYTIALGEGTAKDAITIDPETGKVTINAVGEATITATAEETAIYTSAVAKYYLNVTETASGVAAVEIDLSSQGYKNEAEVESVTANPVTLTFVGGKYYNTGSSVRVYGGKSMTVSSSKTIVKVEITFGTGDKTNTISTNVGTYKDGAWTGESTNVKFTVGGKSGHRRIQKVKVTYNQ